MSTLKKPVPFGKYYLLERINVGGMAEVFKAKTFGVEGFERLLAVKRILPNIAEDEEFITMFIDEAKIAVQLQHANIAQIFDLGKVEDSYFIALEYVNGRDLRSIFDRMRSRGEALPIALACHVMMQVCEGLDYAHNKRDGQGRELHLIHRDISPQNVLIGYDGEVKLIDFGIAKAAGKASTTQAGILKGKFGYMSPEQVRGLPIDKRSDIFAVGIVLYELLTGERLFVGETDFSTLEKVRNVEIVPPSSYNKKIPQELERLMMKALARDPEDRYSNAIDLHDDLQSFLYSIGEFYSRKDLAGWMKKTFAAEIEEDNAKIEQYRQIAAPVGASNEVSRRAAVAGAGSRVGAPPVPLSKDATKDMRPDKNVPSAMGWDDEELDTQIFDKTDENAVDKTVEQSAADLFFEDDDRTVANEPPPDILEQARPPEILATPKPQRRPTAPIRTVSEEINLTPPPLTPPKPPVPRRPTLTGVPPTPLRSPTRPLAPLPPPPPVPAPPRTTPAQLRRSGFNLPPAQVGAPPTPSSTLPYSPQPPGTFAHPAAAPLPPPPPPLGPAPMPPPRQNFHQPQPQSAPAPFGAGNFSDELSRGRSKGGSGFLKVAIVLLLAAGGSAAYWYMNTTKPGRIEITTVPADATVLVDNTKVGDHSPVSLDRSAGPYTVSVTREGYVRNDQNVEVHAGQPLPLTVTLEPSPDTGFELTSEPPGGLVWLDGAPIQGAAGQQARTDFRAFRIAPGHHLLEIKGENRFKPWRQDVQVEPGAIQKVHAMLIPVSGTPGAGKPASHPEAAVTPPPPPPPPPAPAPHNAPPSPPVETHEAGVALSPSSSPHVPRHRKAHDVGLDDGGDGAAASADDDSGPKGDCTMTVNSVPWSEVWIDGKNTSQHTPVVDFKIPCGKHKLAFKRSDMQIDHSETINVRPGQNFKQRYTLATDD